MNNKIAILLLTQKGYIPEANLIIDRLNKLKLPNYFQCYFACKEINDFQINSNWKKLNISLDCQAWGSEILSALNLIKEEYIFIFLDDFYPFRYFSSSKLKEKIDRSLKYNPSLIRINSNYNRRIFLRKKEKNIYEESYLHRYGTSLVLPIFKKNFLIEILNKEDSPWIFERYSTKRFNFKDHKFLFIKGFELNFKVANIVVRGKLLRTSIYRIPLHIRLNYLRNTKKFRKSLISELRFHLKKLFHDIFMRYLPKI